MKELSSTQNITRNLTTDAPKQLVAAASSTHPAHFTAWWRHQVQGQLAGRREWQRRVGQYPKAKGGLRQCRARKGVGHERVAVGVGLDGGRFGAVECAGKL